MFICICILKCSVFRRGATALSKGLEMEGNNYFFCQSLEQCKLASVSVSQQRLRASNSAEQREGSSKPLRLKQVWISQARRLGLH